MNINIRVFYKSEKIDERIDRALEQLFLKVGLRRWASGYSFSNRERDLAFEGELKFPV